jgi:hypothetical protein
MPIGVGAAMLIGAGVQAVGSVISAKKQGDAAKKAAAVQSRSNDQAFGAITRGYEESRDAMAPYARVGGAANDLMGQLMSPTSRYDPGQPINGPMGLGGGGGPMGPPGPPGGPMPGPPQGPPPGAMGGRMQDMFRRGQGAEMPPDGAPMPGRMGPPPPQPMGRAPMGPPPPQGAPPQYYQPYQRRSMGDMYQS